MLRVATAADAPAIAALVNAAFHVERFFKSGDRTDVDDIRAHLQSGEFLLLETEQDAGCLTLAGCVYVERSGPRAYFGMLSIDPARQGEGLGRRLVEAVEAHCRREGCTEIRIHVVNLRAELPPFYRRLGYAESGTLPFPDDGGTTRPCHLVVMTKALASSG